ncbi:MAG: hypothetical protein IJ815_08765 [Lachnospiraceae bacterium]|nr:hypothetical protein [Lachnospiraceae bacterium]
MHFLLFSFSEILSYQNSSKALIDHVDEDDKLNNETLSSLGQRGGWLINESGLYSLIMWAPKGQAFIYTSLAAEGLIVHR